MQSQEKQKRHGAPGQVMEQDQGVQLRATLHNGGKVMFSQQE